MLEYKDDKLGIIKVLNVTEARSHFASMLGDRNSRYIITKNNKPLRAIIDYAEYEYLKNTFGDQLPQRSQIAETEYPSHVEGDDATEQEKKSKKSKSRVPGILESHIALSFSTPDKRHRTQPKEEAGTWPIAQPGPTTTFGETPAPEKKIIQENEDDYFSASSAESDIEQHILPAIEDSVAETKPEKDLAPAIAPKPEPTEQRIERKAERPATRSSEPKKESGEEEEYFRKYRKLYETLGMGSSPQEDSESAAGLVEENTGQDIEDELEPAEHNEEALIGAHAETEQGVDAKERQPNNVMSPQEQAPTRGGRDTQENSEELPSLKDLLASLEQEKLTGEDEEVDESQIEDLIQRITED